MLSLGSGRQQDEANARDFQPDSRHRVQFDTRIHPRYAMHSRTRQIQPPGALQWTPLGRAIVFMLAACSIWCLLAEMYHLCSMRLFTFAVLIPAMFALEIGRASCRERV